MDILEIMKQRHSVRQYKSRPAEQLCTVAGEMPEWFKRSMEAAMYALIRALQLAVEITGSLPDRAEE